jgi:urease accessory protein UreF
MSAAQASTTTGAAAITAGAAALHVSAAPEAADDPLLTWRLWQLLDSAFPTGAFAHSGGLEAAAHAGQLPAGDEATLEHFIASLIASLCSLSLPFMLAARAVGARSGAGDADVAVAHVAALCGEMGAHYAGSAVARRASVAAGGALLRAGGAAFPEHAPALEALRRRCAAAGSAGGGVHGAPAFGLLCGLLGLSRGATARAAAFTALRDAASAATRLGIVGPMAAAALQARLAPRCEALLRDALAADVAPAEAAAAAPLLDTLQAGHDALFARLFQS